MAEEKYFLKYTGEQIDERLDKAGNAVLFTAQNLTDAQKTRARENIGAGMVKTVNGVAPGENGNVNVSGSGGPADAVLYTEQTLTPEQQAQARKNIGAADGAFFEKLAIPSKNLLNPETVTPGYYTNWSNGKLSANANKECTDFIAVTPGETLVCSWAPYPDANLYWTKCGMQYPTFYDFNKKYLSGLSSQPDILVVPGEAAYLRCSFPLGYSAGKYIQIEVSADGEITEYEPYGTTLVTKLRSDITVPEVEAARGGYATLGQRMDAMSPGILNLPSKLYGLVGEELNIYFDNLVDGHDTDYSFDVTCSVGMQLERCYRLIPEAAGTYGITVSATDKHGMTVKKSGTIYVADAAAGSGAAKKVIVLGDSTTNNGIMITKLNDNFSGDAMGLTALGTRGTSPNNHEGRSGWTFRQYFETQVDANLPDVVNPFYNPTTKTFDAAYYFANSGVAIPDWFFINLGINDTFGYGNDLALANAMPTLTTYCNRMITSLKAAAPNIKIGVCLTIPPNYSQDAFGKAYKCGQTRNRYKRNNVLWVQNQIATYDGREAENIFLVPIYTNLDTKYNMGMEQIQYNKRNTEKYASPIGNGGVHPVESGYWQIADVLWFFLKNNA